MNAEKWNEVKRIFNQVVEMPLEKQPDFLASVVQDADIQFEVEKLLISDREAKSISGGIIPFPAKNTLPPERIGNYKIIREIGEGGMGTVFLASREDFEKQVALKIIKFEFSSREILRRFQNERKILASLEHPNIARLFDGGTTDRGLPFFVMEFVEGEDLLTYCSSRDLSIDERLKIFRKICSAVSYAHNKLIVHRDLKPSNILVGKDGEPKLLDFGISKLLNEDSFEQTGTATALGMMTPNYASPEQFRGETVSTSTDVYSLGVILYELLTGFLPYQINHKRIDEVVRIICDTDPQKPSDAISEFWTKSKKNTDQNKVKQTNNPKSKIQNPKSLRGDLDNIILKSLRKEPERRYSSVEKFSEDLRRHLEGLPVTARRDTFGYRAEKFINRNRITVSAGLLILLTLLGGIATTTWQAIRAERERKIAELRFNQVRELANNVVFKYHDEIKDLQGATRVRQMMVEDALKYLDNLQSEAGRDAALTRELAQAYMRIADVQGGSYQANLGDSAGALESYQKAINLLEPLIDKSSDVKLLSELRDAYLESGRAFYRVGNFERQNEQCAKSVDLSEKIISIVPQDFEQKASLARSYIFWGDSSSDNLDQRVELYRKGFMLIDEALKTNPDDETLNRMLATATQRLQLNFYSKALIAKQNKQFEKSAGIFQEALTFARRSTAAQAKVLQMSPENTRYQRNVGGAKLNEGKILRELGQTDAALQLEKEAMTMFLTIAGKDSTNNEIKLDLKEAYEDLAYTYLRSGKKTQAFANYNQSVVYSEELLKKDPANYEFWVARLDGYKVFGDALRENGENESARRIYRDALARAQNEAPKQFTEFIQKFKKEIDERLIQ